MADGDDADADAAPRLEKKGDDDCMKDDGDAAAVVALALVIEGMDRRNAEDVTEDGAMVAW